MRLSFRLSLEFLTPGKHARQQKCFCQCTLSAEREAREPLEPRPLGNLRATIEPVTERDQVIHGQIASQGLLVEMLQ